MARLFLEYVDQGGGFSDAVARRFVEAARDSRLLCDWFLSSSLCDRYRHSIATIPGDNSPSAESISATIFCALANVEGDLDVALADLCSARDRQAQGYLAAMQSGDSIAALRSLGASRTSHRILTAAHEGTARARIEDELSSIKDPSLLTMLRIIETLISRCYRKACRVAAQGN